MQNPLNTPILYHSKTSVCSQKVRLILAELDVVWESKVLDLKQGDQFEVDYLELNPNATVPTLQDGSRTLIQSNDIIRYLCKAHSNNLVPSSSEKLLQIDYWLDVSISLHASVHVLTMLAMNRDKYLKLEPQILNAKLARIPDRERAARILDVVKNGAQGSAVKDAVNNVVVILQELEMALCAKSFIVSDQPTMADFAILPFLSRLKFMGLIPDWRGASFDKILKWMGRLENRPSYQTAVLLFHSDAVLENYAIYGAQTRQAILGR